MSPSFKSSYSKWPSETKGKQKMAKEVFGQDIVTIREKARKYLKNTILEGKLLKNPSTTDEEIAVFVGKFTQDEKEKIISVVDKVLDYTFLRIMNTLDGSGGGSWLDTEQTRFGLFLEIFDEDSENLKESIAINPVDQEEELHEAYFRWLSE